MYYGCDGSSPQQIPLSTEDTYRIPEEDITGIPPIPIQPIGFEDAYKLIWSGFFLFVCFFHLKPDMDLYSKVKSKFYFF